MDLPLNLRQCFVKPWIMEWNTQAVALFQSTVSKNISDSRDDAKRSG